MKQMDRRPIVSVLRLRVRPPGTRNINQLAGRLQVADAMVMLAELLAYLDRPPTHRLYQRVFRTGTWEYVYQPTSVRCSVR